MQKGKYKEQLRNEKEANKLCIDKKIPPKFPSEEFFKSGSTYFPVPSPA